MAAANSVPTELVEDVGQQDEDQAGRDDLSERAGGADGAAGQPLVVAAPEHAGQRQQPERHHGGADDPGGRAHQHADQDNADAEPAAQRAGGVADHIHQVFCQPGAFQHHAHEDKERDREQGRIGDDAEDAVRQQVEQQRAEAEIAEDQAGDRERHADRDAGHQQHEERHQHQDREDFVAKHRARSGRRWCF